MADIKTYPDGKKKYNKEYTAENIKRIPLEVQTYQCEVIDKAALELGMKRNQFIKIAIEEKLRSMGIEWPVAEGKAGRKPVIKE